MPRTPGGVSARRAWLGVVLALLALGVLLSTLPQVRERASLALDPAKRRLSKAFEQGAGPEQAAGKQGMLYRWRAADGVVHIESAPPADDSEYEVITYAIEPPAPARPSAQKGDATRAARSELEELPFDSPLDVYSPGGMEKLLHRVEELASRLEQRRRLIEELESQL